MCLVLPGMLMRSSDLSCKLQTLTTRPVRYKLGPRAQLACSLWGLPDTWQPCQHAKKPSYRFTHLLLPAGPGIVGAGTNNARLAGILRSLGSYYYKEPTLLLLVRLAQGLVHLGKGLASLAPAHADGTLVSGEPRPQKE